jgi:regulatory protein
MTGDDATATPLDLAALERAAIDYLARYAASRTAVARVLARNLARGPAPDAETAARAIDAVLDRIAALGLLDDARFAEGRARSLAARGRSGSAIRERLRASGVARDGIDQAMARLAEESGDPELVAALALARRRRLGPWRPEAARAARRERDLAVFARAGFSRALAIRIVDAADLTALDRIAAEPGA